MIIKTKKSNNNNDHNPKRNTEKSDIFDRLGILVRAQLNTQYWKHVQFMVVAMCANELYEWYVVL